MPRKQTSALAARLAELDIDPPIEPHELAAIVRRPLAEVAQWIAAAELGGEAAVLCRPLFVSDEAAEAAILSVRGTDTPGAQYAPMARIGPADGWSHDIGKRDVLPGASA